MASSAAPAFGASALIVVFGPGFGLVLVLPAPLPHYWSIGDWLAALRRTTGGRGVRAQESRAIAPHYQWPMENTRGVALQDALWCCGAPQSDHAPRVPPPPTTTFVTEVLRIGSVFRRVAAFHEGISNACRSTLRGVFQVRANFPLEDTTRRRSSIGCMLTRAVTAHIIGHMDDQQLTAACGASSTDVMEAS